MVFSLGGSNPLEKSNACLVVRGTSPLRRGSLAEWSKALVLGTSPKGRGFESHSCQEHKVFLVRLVHTLSEVKSSCSR